MTTRLTSFIVSLFLSARVWAVGHITVPAKAANIIRLIKNDESLIEALGAASVFFGTDFSPMLSLRALSYYDDLLPPLSPSDSSFLKCQVSEALRSLSIKGLEKPALASANLSSKEVNNL